MNDAAQVRENIRLASGAAANSITTADRDVYAAAVAAFRAAFKVPCTGCNYCMPCPQNVNIPGCFAAYNASFAVNFIEGAKQYMTNTAATSKNTHVASKCVGCATCEGHCPQKIAIRAELKRVKGRMEPWWIKVAMRAARAGLRA
jgi:predicted aldo/keto reductase-like oxidoreductase